MIAEVKKGEEKYETYFSNITKKTRLQYDYRNHDGKLFSCCASTLAEARALRDAWLEGRGE